MINTNLPDDLQKKISQAELLRSKKNSLLSLFLKPKFLESAILFEEVAENNNLTPEEKIKYYNEAGDTYNLDGSEFCLFKASECYYRVYELTIQYDREKGAEYLLRSCKNLDAIRNFDVAGIRYTELGALYELDEFEKARIYFEEAIRCYQEVPGFTYTLKSAKRKLISCALFHKKEESVYEIILKHNFSFSHRKFCLLLLLYLMERHEEVVEEADHLTDDREKNIIDDVLHADKNKAETVIKELFMNISGSDDICNSIIQLFIEKFTDDENEYC